MELKSNLSPSAVLATALCAVMLVACSKATETGPAVPTLPEVTPDYRTEMAPIFQVQQPVAEAPQHDERAQLGRVLFLSLIHI